MHDWLYMCVLCPQALLQEAAERLSGPAHAYRRAEMLRALSESFRRVKNRDPKRRNWTETLHSRLSTH